MPASGSLRAAAQYLRRSTGEQTFSFEQQETAIATYAADRGYRIVRTYRDEGSGLDLKGRPGLRDLLTDVLGPGAGPGFGAILVYDVSRWGRFQDLDQGAHYEFLCRRAGLSVEYCVEPFENDGSAESNLIKQLKRSMAAEYSRQLSDQISVAKRRAAAKGYIQSGRVPFGLARQVVDAHGTPIGLLTRTGRRAEGAYRTTLVPGPDAEVAAVRRIFRLFTITGLGLEAIAAELADSGLDPAPAKSWTPLGVRRILRNPAYVGTYVYGRRVSRLRTGVSRADPNTWIVVEDAFPALVAKEIFLRAQSLLDRSRHHRSDADMLEDLRQLLAREGRITTALVNADPACLGARVYIRRFGGLKRARALIGDPVGASRTARRRMSGQERPPLAR